MEPPLFLLFLLLLLLFSPVLSLRLRGSFRSSDFFLFLSRFGFQRTEHHPRGAATDRAGGAHASEGFIFGNVTLDPEHG